jgi:hypothetical protein
MSLIEEKLTDQFYEWEIRGRGWEVWDVPVSLEPPFRPFYGHYVLPESIPDDGRRPTLLSSLVSRLSKGLSGEQELPEIPEEDEEPEPELLLRSNLVELQASLPATLNVSRDAIEQVLLSLAYCHEPVSFELIASHDAIITQFAVAEQDVERVQQQLEAHFPEGVFMPHSCVLEHKWRESQGTETLIVDFGLSREFMSPLAVARNFNFDPFIGITGALSKLEEGELALFQVIFQPARHPWGESILRSVTDNTGGDFFVNAPELSKEARNKISRPLYAAIVRVAIKTETYERSLEIARALAGALTVFSNPSGNEFIPLENSAYPLPAHEEDVLRRQTRRIGMLLNSDELISLVHLPSSSVRTPKLQREIRKTKAAPKTVLNQSGIFLGENSHGGKTTEVRLNSEQRVRHMHCIGASGTGKSTFLFNLIRQDIESGQGVAVFDPHGDLIEKILGCIPKDRVADVVLVDPSDEEYSVGFNILAAHSDLEKNLLASDLVSVFQRLSTSWGDQINSVLNNAVLAFLESERGGTLVDLRRFLIETEFRNDFLKSVNDAEVIYYWKKAFPLLSGNKSVGPIVTRLDTFLGRKPIRHMVSQKQNKLDIAEIMNSGKIFLAKLSQGKIGKENAYLLGSFLVSKFQQSAMARQEIAEARRRDFWLYVDEFHNFITPSMAEILSGARKYRLGLILAHQELRQMQRESEVGSAVLSNSATRVCFRLGDNDAKALDSGFSFFEAKDLQNLETGEAICRVERSDFDFNLSVPLRPDVSEAEAAETRKQAVTVSREKYAVSRRQIEVEQIREILDDEPAPKKTKRATERAAPEQPAPVAAMQPTPIEEATTSAPVQPADSLPVSEVPKSKETKEIFGTSEAKLEPVQPEPAKPPPQDRGIGGNQHNLIRERIELVARQLGYSTSREDPTGKGGKIDVVLEEANRAIACEIAITTTIDHEVGNVAKCIEGRFKYIAVISPSADRLEKIKAGVCASLSPEETARVVYFHPDKFISFLQELAIAEAQEVEAATPKAKQYGKYKIKSSVANLTSEEIKARESAALGLLADTMRRKK